MATMNRDCINRTRKSDVSIHVLVVDDSAVVRQVMQVVLGSDPKIRVSVAADPIIAFAKIHKEKPDVVITDLVMPRMDGLAFLRKIMAEMPLPVIVCSEVAHHRTEDAISALELGAVEVIKKPKLGVRGFLEESRVMLHDVVRSAAQARVLPMPLIPVGPRNTADVVLPLRPLSHACTAADMSAEKIIAIGASTGGTEALREFLRAMPQDCPGIVIVQHMPEVFTRAFSDRLNRDCQIEVKEAADGDRIVRGRALIAPGNHHLLVKRMGPGYAAEVSNGPLVSRHRPSVDVLFRSVAKSAGSKATGIIMTGMGDDGAQGMLEMRNCGARTIAQDESSCVVFGMPKEAIRRGGATAVVPLRRIAETALRMSAEF
jgi:two-component system, chemotaxis family, protein-glutamate methylesterase/glutaminase